jgi:putative addiction module antidote
MFKEASIRKIGNAAGLTIPKAMLERYNLSDGDKVYLVETEAGLLISPLDPTFAEALALYKEGANAYRNAMKELS